MKNNHTEKLIYFLIGLGSGIVISGIFTLTLIFNIKQENSLTIPTEEMKQQTQGLQNKTSEINYDIEKETQITENVSQVTEKVEPIYEETTAAVDDKQEIKTTQELVEVVIPVNTSAKKVCEILQEKQIISDSNDFLNYMRTEGKTRRIRSATVVIPKGASYEEILNILTKKK